ncbi:MAG TPA: branched-chain amino acid ABC transporter permease [Gammaproteobacteria bacterium]
MNKLQWVIGALILFLLLAVPPFLKNYGVYLFSYWLVFVIATMGLNLTVGYAGQKSLGHAAFFGIGAYTSAILTTRFGWSPWLAMALALLIVWLLATLIARPILKLKGHYLAMATLGLGIIANIVMKQEVDWTGGPDGMGGIPGLNLLGWTIDRDLEWYGVIAVTMLATVLLSLNLIDSRAGRALRAVHGSDVAAQTLGIDTAKVKAQVFVLSALLTCFTGSLFAHQQGFVSPDSFSFFFSIELVTMVVLGGLGSTYGAVFGAVLLTFLPEILVVFEDYEVLIFGAILMSIMIFLPQGLFVGVTRGAGALWRRLRSGGDGGSRGRPGTAET